MHPVRKNLGGGRRVGGIRLPECRYHIGVQVGDREFLVGRQLFDVVAVFEQHLVVAAFEQGRARHIVIGRGHNGGDPNPRQLALQGVHNVFVARAEFVEEGLIERAVMAVVHPQHNGHHGGIVRQHVPPDADVDGSAASAAHAVAAPSGMDEGDVHPGESRDYIGLGEGGVEPLIGDAVAVEHHAVSFVEGEGLRRSGGAPQGRGRREIQKQSA